MKKSDFHFDLPPELIAQAPLAERSASRLLVLDGDAERLVDARFRDLLDLLQPGDLLVFNDTRVIPARLFGRKHSGGEVEVLIERVIGAHEVLAQMRASNSPKPGTQLMLGDGVPVTVLGRDGAFFHLRFDTPEPLESVLHRIGRMPLPPYIKDVDHQRDTTRYQTVFARAPGAVAAPTAGLHFDAPLLDDLRARGVQFGHVTLHVGAGTFQPMRVDSVHEHTMHSEWLNVGAELCEQMRATRAAGHRVVAVGTTVVRALESAMRDGEVKPFAGETRIFIFPGYRIRSVDALVTNFHLPESTLLMLVSAFAGRERVLAAYRHAVEQRYRFFSYGDAMFIVPPKDSLMQFTLHTTDGRARRGQLQFERGNVETPAFMPVGTYGSVKGMTPQQVLDIGAEIILGNTFHLWLRPGTDVIDAHGGLHGFIGWDKPILTHSGGFQVWSLAERRKITKEGVHFASPVDGSKVFLSPEESMRIQRALNSDIVMIFDECTPYPATEPQARD